MKFSTISIMYQILKTDLIKYFKNSFLNHFINTLIYVVCVILTTGYVLPQLGLNSSYGTFIAVGTIVSSAFWDSWSVTTQFISDLEGSRVINYYLTLPLRSSLFFGKQIIFYALRSMASALLIIPIFKVILLDKFNVVPVSIPYFLLTFVTSCLLCATLSLFMVSLVKGMSQIDNISMRFLFPMWFFGGSQFTWQTLHGISPVLAYLSFANPLLYAMEAIRISFLGQSGYLPYWLCISAMFLFTVIFGYVSTRRLMRRLDCV